MDSFFFIKNYNLKLYQSEDFEAFADLFTNEELCKYMAGGAFSHKSEAAVLFEKLIKISSQKNTKQKAYGIFENHKLIGHFEYLKTKDEMEIIYLLAKEYWGKGIMKKIIVFINKSNSEQLVARLMPNNSNSSKMLKKVGIASKSIVKFNTKRVIKYYLKK